MSYYYAKPYSPKPVKTTKVTLLADNSATGTEWKAVESLQDDCKAGVSLSSPMNAEARSPVDCLADTLLPKSITSYSPFNRTIYEKNLCTHCHKPLSQEPRMVLDDEEISCHASCFKCDLCNGSLGHLKAGDNMWVHRHMVYCGHCFSITREQWHSSN
ncbi:sciellin-like [Paramormyrops kingsleyae]|uniref:sciellin-like n=1 Tax=Paramormyrops kingsleyae TaxID=1676925 RepID=UPI003B9712BB